jgi:hypothetical protein
MNHPNSSEGISGHGAVTVAPSSSTGALMMNPQTPFDACSTMASSTTDGRSEAEDAAACPKPASPSAAMLESGRQIVSAAVRSALRVMSTRPHRRPLDGSADLARQ